MKSVKMLRIKEPTGHIHYIQTYKGETVGNLREFLYEHYNYPKEQVRISHNNQILNDDYVFEDEKKESILELFCWYPSSTLVFEKKLQEKKDINFIKFDKVNTQDEQEPCPRRIPDPVQFKITTKSQKKEQSSKRPKTN